MWSRWLVGSRFGCWLGRSLLPGSPPLGLRALSTQRKPRLDWVRAGRYHADTNAGTACSRRGRLALPKALKKVCAGGLLRSWVRFVIFPFRLSLRTAMYPSKGAWLYALFFFRANAASVAGSAALLAFALSIDDFIITFFNSGSTVTFPLQIFGASRVAIPPQINVLATAILLVSVALLLAGNLFGNRRGRSVDGP